MARNVTGGTGGKRWAAEFSNLRDVQEQFNKIAASISGLSGKNENPVATRILNQRWSEISEFFRDRIRAMAAARGVPRRVQAAVFAFSDIRRATYGNRGREGTTYRERSSLVGVRKGAPPWRDDRIYVEWRGTGKTIGMGLATIFEKGTKNRSIKPKRYFRTAYFQSRSAVLTKLANAYREAIGVFNRR
jgi:hypothetical protein